MKTIENKRLAVPGSLIALKPMLGRGRDLGHALLQVTESGRYCFKGLFLGILGGF